jgi:SPP1 family phage portal protein
MIENRVIEMFKNGSVFPNDEHFERIQRYKTNELLFKGKPYQAWSQSKVLTKAQKNILQISVNLPSIICKKSADFLFGDGLKVLSGKGDDTREQLAFDRLVETNDLNILNYESALSNAYFGDAFIKVRYGQEYNGMLPIEIDEPRIFIENIDPKTVFPEELEYNKDKLKCIHIAVPVEDEDGTYILSVESHYPNMVLYTSYKATPLHYNILGDIDRWMIQSEIEDKRHYVLTGVPTPLVVHIPNTGIVGQWEGIDDLTEHHGILDEINNRLAQISDILDKHSDPAMAVPTGLLTEDDDGMASFKVAHDKVFEVMGKDDVLPQYITWNGQLNEAFTELDKLVELLLTTAEIPTVVLGKGDSGTSGSSGLAIKWRMNSLLSKINRKRQYYHKGLKTVFYIAQTLETNLGLADYTVTIPLLQFNDGLPKDEMEQANIMSIRSGGAKTISQKTAIMRLNNMTEEQAQKEIDRIKQEEESNLTQVDEEFMDGSIETANLSFTDVNEEQVGELAI